MNSVIVGDVRDVLPSMEAESFQMCVTSPPYWGLRDYGVDGQLGLEPTPDEYVSRMVGVFREVRRVLRDDGTLWVNLGTSYAGSGKGGGGSYEKDGMTRSAGLSVSGGKNASRSPLLQRVPACGRSDCQGIGKCGFCWCSLAIPSLNIKPKDEVNIPHLVAMALQADGWVLRQTIVWSKPNPLPESVTDRCTKAHEYLFLLSKSARYYFDADAIAEQSTYNDARKPYAPGQVDERGNGHDRNGGQVRTMGVRDTDKRNKRSVWTVNSQPYAEAHFATFPPKLIEPCILAGSRSGDVVLDPFFGSGTTGEVCERLGRQWLGIELNLDYVEMAKRRTAQMGLRI